jgi:hypothetical protein
MRYENGYRESPSDMDAAGTASVREKLHELSAYRSRIAEAWTVREREISGKALARSSQSL